MSVGSNIFNAMMAKKLQEIASINLKQFINIPSDENIKSSVADTLHENISKYVADILIINLYNVKRKTKKIKSKSKIFRTKYYKISILIKNAAPIPSFEMIQNLENPSTLNVNVTFNYQSVHELKREVRWKQMKK